jgi:hypothetical protein
VPAARAEPERVREHAHRPQAEEDDRGRDDAEPVIARADGDADRRDDPERRSRRQALDVDAVLDDRAGAEEPDSRDHVCDDTRGVEHDADVVPELELRPREVPDDDEEGGPEPDEHVGPKASLLVAQLALESDGACEQDDKQQSRHSFPQR